MILIRFINIFGLFLRMINRLLTISIRFLGLFNKVLISSYDSLSYFDSLERTSLYEIVGQLNKDFISVFELDVKETNSVHRINDVFGQVFLYFMDILDNFLIT